MPSKQAEEAKKIKELEEKMITCPLRDIMGLGDELPPHQYRIAARQNDLTPQGKLSLQQMAGAHGFSQRPEYTIPFSRRIYRCGWEGCRATHNPNGVEKATRAHFKQMHKALSRAIQITLDRHDGKSMTFLIPRGTKPVAIPHPKEPMQRPDSKKDCESEMVGEGEGEEIAQGHL